VGVGEEDIFSNVGGGDGHCLNERLEHCDAHLVAAVLPGTSPSARALAHHLHSRNGTECINKLVSQQ